jgi:protein-arginine kinase activator protein McsA
MAHCLGYEFGGIKDVHIMSLTTLKKSSPEAYYMIHSISIEELEHDLKEAIEDERYETAAIIRDVLIERKR